MLRRTLTLLLALAAWSRGAAAQSVTPVRVRLSAVRGPGAESCPDAMAIGLDVAQRLGRDPVDPTAVRSLDVAIHRTPTGWAAEILSRATENAPPAVRALSLTGATCEPLANALGLAVALAIDPDASGARHQGPLLTVPSPASPPTPAVCPPSPPCVTTPQPLPPVLPSVPPVVPTGVPAVVSRVVPGPSEGDPRVLHGALALHGGVSWGTAPAPAAGIMVRMHTPGYGFFRGTVGVAFNPSVRGGDGSLGFGWTAVLPGVCVGSRGARVRVEGCAGAVVGVVHATVYGLTPVAPGDYPAAGAWADATLRVYLVGPVHAEAVLRGTVALTRPRFQVEGRADTTLVPAAAGVDTMLGAGVDFP